MKLFVSILTVLFLFVALQQQVLPVVQQAFYRTALPESEKRLNVNGIAEGIISRIQSKNEIDLDEFSKVVMYFCVSQSKQHYDNYPTACLGMQALLAQMKESISPSENNIYKFTNVVDPKSSKQLIYSTIPAEKIIAFLQTYQKS